MGAAGMAGHVIYGVLRKESDFEVLAHARTSKSFRWADYAADLLEPGILEYLLREVAPNVVVNCVGMLVSASNERPDLATYINAYVPRRLEHLGLELGFRTIHLSTDCVFDGELGLYTDRAQKNESKPYGLSKSLGELANDRDCTIRMSIIGPELKSDGAGLLSWFLRQKGKIQGYDNAYWNGITTLELARFIHRVIDENITGLVQVASLAPITKFALLNTFCAVYERENWVEIVPHTLDKTVDKTLEISSQLRYKPSAILTQLETLKFWYEENKQWISASV